MELDWYRCTGAVEDAKNHIVDWLNEAAESGDGEEMYVSDIGMEITESENVNGVWDMGGAPEAIKDAFTNWGLSAYMAEYCKDNLDMDIGKEFFENPEKFWLICMIELVDQMWQQVASDIGLDDTVVITKELADKVEKALGKYKTISDLGMAD